MQPVGSRLLAPAPTPPTRTEDSPTGALSPAHSHHATTGIRRASTACQSCKQIKRKCDQSQPCSNCRKSNTRCVYNEAEDGRRKAARKRTVENLESKCDALDSILDAFRMSSEGHAQHLLQKVRENASLDEIVQYVTTHKGNLPRRQLQDIVSQIDEQPRKNVMSVTALCDTPLVQLPSQPWTSVTLDDDFVSHLISIFFTWYTTAYPTLDRESFLRDMAAGSIDCRFCSPLLVNAVLALACNFSDHPKSCRIPSDETTRGQHFFTEATRLWNAEEGRPSLVNLQAASLLAVASCLVGKDRLSWSYVEQMNEMDHELRLRQLRMRKLESQQIDPELEQAEAITSETVFLLTVGYGIAFMKPSINPKRLHPDCSSRSLMRKVRWIPYPEQQPEAMYDPDLLHRAFCELHRLGFRIQNSLFGSDANVSGANTTTLDEQLSDWMASLPGDLHMGPETSAVRPPILNLHLTYHFLRITLFNFPKDSKIHDSSGSSPLAQRAHATSVASQNESWPRYQTKTSTDPVHALLYHQAQSLDSAKAIASLCRLYARDLGLKQLSMWMPQAAASAAYSLIDGPIPLTDAEVSEIFHELCLVLTATSRRWLVMKGHVRMLLMTADSKNQNMHVRTKQLLQFVALDQWRDNDHKIFASSVYPNYVLAKDVDDPRLSGMGDLLEMWAGIKIRQERITAERESLDTSAVDSRLTSVTPSHSQGHSIDRGFDVQ